MHRTDNGRYFNGRWLNYKTLEEAQKWTKSSTSNSPFSDSHFTRKCTTKNGYSFNELCTATNAPLRQSVITKTREMAKNYKPLSSEDRPMNKDNQDGIFVSDNIEKPYYRNDIGNPKPHSNGKVIQYEPDKKRIRNFSYYTNERREAADLRAEQNNEKLYRSTRYKTAEGLLPPPPPLVKIKKSTNSKRHTHPNTNQMVKSGRLPIQKRFSEKESANYMEYPVQYGFNGQMFASEHQKKSYDKAFRKDQELSAYDSAYLINRGFLAGEEVLTKHQQKKRLKFSVEEFDQQKHDIMRSITRPMDGKYGCRSHDMHQNVTTNDKDINMIKNSTINSLQPLKLQKIRCARTDWQVNHTINSQTRLYERDKTTINPEQYQEAGNYCPCNICGSVESSERIHAKSLVDGRSYLSIDVEKQGHIPLKRHLSQRTQPLLGTTYSESKIPGMKQQIEKTCLVKEEHQKALSPVKKTQVDQNENEVYSQKPPMHRAKTLQTSQIFHNYNVHNKIPLKRALSDSDVIEQKINDSPLVNKSKPYGGFAFDHESLPIIIAVHSASLNDTSSHDVSSTIHCNSSKESTSNHFEGKKWVVTGSSEPEESNSTCVIKKEATGTNSVKINSLKRLSPVKKCLSAPLTDRVKNELIKTSAIEASPFKGYVKKEMLSTSLISVEEKPETNETMIKDFDKKPPTHKTSQSIKQGKNPETVESLTKKIEETRQREKDEKIEWKKKLLVRLEYVLTKRLRKIEDLTGVKSTLTFPANKQEKSKNKKESKQEKKLESPVLKEIGEKEPKINSIKKK